MIHDNALADVDAWHAFAMRARAARVAVFIMTSESVYETRYSHMARTWLSDARRPGVVVQPYTSRESGARLLDRIPDLIRLNASDSYPPYEMRTQSLRMWMQLAAQNPHIDYFLHVDDDTYVDVNRTMALIQSLDPADWYCIGRPNYHEPRHARSYCGGPFVLYSGSLLRSLFAKATPQRIRELHAMYFSIAPSGGHGDDVLMGFFLERLADVSCVAQPIPGSPPDSIPVRQAIPSDRVEYQQWSRAGQPGTYAWHKVIGTCVVALHAGRPMAECMGQGQ